MSRQTLVWLTAIAAGCAQVGRPPGGPVDDVPPELAEVQPGSVAVDVAPDQALVFRFSERVDRRGFARSLTVVPPVDLDRPSFDDTTVRVAPLESWPADTVVVWTLSADLRDKHGVEMGQAQHGALTRASRLPEGEIRGQASLADPPDAEVGPGKEGGGVQWTSLRASLTLPPREGSRRPRPWREAGGDDEGRFRLLWLEVPSGPFGLKVWLDRNANGARDEREPVAELDSLYLSAADSILTLGAERLRLVDLEAPVPVVFCLAATVRDSVSLQLWIRHEEAQRPQRARIDSTACTSPVEVRPGRVEWGGWVDRDGDGRFGPDSTGISEPWIAPRELQLEPARPETISVAWPDSVLPWAVVDTLRSSIVPDDLLVAPPPEQGR